MKASANWQDYELLDTSDGEKLERWGKVCLIRPDPQVIWKTPRRSPQWEKASAHYHRSNRGGGYWEQLRPTPESWQISYRNLRFLVRPTGFKHTGLFPEQAVNWDLFSDMIKSANRPISVLNLFGYTGGATLACAAAGASVCHVDASKGMVAWGKENAALSGLADKPIRWIVDDCAKFVAREIRRGRTYDAVIMDPPSYGRGPSGEMWKLEAQIYDLVSLTSQLLSGNPLFFAINSYTTGLSPSVMSYLLGMTVGAAHDGIVSADEIGLPVSESGFCLPCGSTALWVNRKAGEAVGLVD